MKLRLPSALRKALLACLAALASLAPLALTSASGSLFAGALVWSLASSPIQAKEITWKGGSGATWKTDDSSNWWISDGGDTGNANFEDNDDVTFSIGDLAAPQTVTLGSNVAAGNIILDGGEWTFTNGGSFALTLAGDIELQGTDAGPTGDFSGVSVILTGDAPHEFIGKGTITFGAIAGDGNGWTVGNGTDVTTVYLTNKQTPTTDHNFGAVEVKEGSKLVISADGSNNAWGNCNDSGVGDDYVYGEGTVVLSCGNNFMNPGQNQAIHLFNALLKGMKDGETLGTLQIGEGIEGENAAFKFANNNGFAELGQTLAKHVKNIVVTAGNSLDLQGVQLLVKPEGGGIEGGNTLHIVGDGRLDSGTLLGALSIRTSATTVGWSVELDDDARIGTHDVAGTLTGNLITNGHILTKSGGNSLTLSGTITGELKLNFVAGKVVLGLNGNNGGTVAEVSTETSGSGTLEAVENANWTLESLNVAADTNLTLAGAGTFNLSDALSLDANGGTVTLGDGTTATKFTGSLTFPSSGDSKWVFSANADLTGLNIVVEGLVVPTENDPFWNFELPEGLEDIPLSQLQPSTGSLGDGQVFGRTASGRIVIQSEDAGLPTEELSFSTGDINWDTNTQQDDATFSVSSIDYNFDNQQYDGEGVTVVATNSSTITVTLSGSTVKWLKLQRKIGVVANAMTTINGLPTNLKALWLNWDATETDNAGVGGFKFGESFNCPSGLTDIYSSGTGLFLDRTSGQTETPFANITIHLGKADKRVYGLSSDIGLQKLALWANTNATISGLEMQESALVAVTTGAVLSIGTLTGSGDLRLATTRQGKGNASSTFIVTQGDQFKGHIDFIFQGHADRKLTVKIADGQTLTTAGIASTNNNDGNTASNYGGGGFAVQDGGSAATVRVLGSNPDAALGITFGEGVTLEIAAGASQAFGHYDKVADEESGELHINTEISKLKGAGALGVTGNVTVKALDNYTGDVHLWNNGALTVGVAGDGVASSSTGTLSKLVLREGESTLNVHGAWTLQGLKQMGGTKLTIGPGAAGDSLTFGGGDAGVTLVDGLTLSLGNGVTYAGKLSIAAGDTPGTGKIELGEGLQDLGDLTIGLTGLSEKGKEWGGLSLFTGTLTDELCRMLEEHLTSDNTDDNLQLKVDTNGKVTLVGLPVLVWTDGSSHTWQDEGGDNVWTPQGGNATQTYTSGVNVIFAAIGDQATQTVEVSGTVHAHNITVGSEGKAVQYTFNAAGGQAATVDVAGNLSLLADSSATFNTAVNLNRVGGTSITGEGTVTFGGAFTGTGNGLTIGDGVSETVVRVTQAASEHNLGSVEVEAKSTLVIEGEALGSGSNAANNSWGGGSNVWGEGTVELRVAEGEGSPAQSLGFSDKENNLLYILLKGSVDANKTLVNLKLGRGVFFTFNSGTQASHFYSCLWAIKDFWVESGAGLRVRADSFTENGTTKGQGVNHTLHISGAGDGTTEDNDDDMALQNSALSTSHSDQTIAWNVAVEGTGATVATAKNMTVTGTFDAKTHNLQKIGDGKLILTKMAAGADHAGAITVNGGTLEISGLADETGAADTLVATTVDLDNADGATGTFKVSGSGKTYTVQKVVMGDGTTNTAGVNDCNAHLTAEAGATLVVQGADDGVALEMTNDKAGWIDGGGTVQLNGKATGSGRIGIDGEGTTLFAKAAWDDDYSGGLYLHGGTLKLGEDVQVGWLGGTDNEYGGSIVVEDGETHTITVTGGGGSATGVKVGSGITLKIGDTKTQDLTNLAGEGTLELGEGAKSVIRGENSTIGSVTNAGTVQVGDGTAAGLTVNGEMTNTGGGSLNLGGGTGAKNASTVVTVGEHLVHNSTGDINVYDGNLTVKGGVTGTGTGTLRVYNGVLTVEGGTEADSFSGYLELRNNAQLKLGTGSGAGYLCVGGLHYSNGWSTQNTSTETVTGKGTLVLDVAEGFTANGNTNAVGLALTFEGDTSLVKKGKGTQQLSGLVAEGNTHVQVTDGVLQIVGLSNNGLGAAATTLNVFDLQVNGSGAALDIARQSLADVENSNHLTLSGGGTLRSSYAGDKIADYHFGNLTLGDGGGSIESSAARQTFSFDSLQGTGDLNLEQAFVGTNNATSHTLNLGSINGYAGTVTAGTLDDNNVLTIDGPIVSGAQGTEGKIEVTGGAVTLKNGVHDELAVLRKTGGEGKFTISHLKVASGQGLQVDYAGGELSIGQLTMEAGAGLHYTAAVMQEGTPMLELAFSQFVTLFTSGEWNVGSDTIELVTEEGIDRGTVGEFYLGITAENADEIADWSAEVLENYFSDRDFGKVTLEWVPDDDNVKQRLYLSWLPSEEAVRYWDTEWDDSSHRNGPNNMQMGKHAALWHNADGSGEWSQMMAQDGSTDFTGVALQLGDDSRWRGNGMYYVRLDKGSSKDGINAEGTKLTVLGGKLYTDRTQGDRLSGRVYISLWAPETEHFHLLVGGSSFVGSNVTAADGLGFKGNTHIQVQGGTVDHLVGGNHVSNSAAGFEGNTYISVYEGNSEHNEDGVPDMGALHEKFGTNVRGGIVGGSTVTATLGNTSEGTKTYDFLGHSHIFIYTVLKSARDAAGHAVTISDGDGDVSNDTELYHIVGGNAWIGLARGQTEQSMVFSGSSNITVDLSQYRNFYHKGDPRGGMDFEKAIVGGNFSSAGASSQEETQPRRSTVFEYNSHGEAKHHPYAVRITVNGTAQDGSNVSFLGGINGASRRDNEGAGTTEFDAASSEGIDIELSGGAYRNYVAGGFWFGGTRVGGASGVETHKGILHAKKIEVRAVGGEYWRVVGGSVSFNGTVQSTGDTTGDTHVTVSGDAQFGLGWDLTSGIPVQKTTVGQDTVALVVGGSYYENTCGIYTHTGSTAVDILSGSFNNAHLVAGDYLIFNSTEEKQNSATLTGGTTLTLGGGGMVSVNGLVVGGSYITDKGKGGKTVIGTEKGEDDESYDKVVTQVSVNAGATLTAEKNEKGETLHDGVALVAGSVLIDEESTEGGAASQGGHSMEIYGGTQADITGGVITGHVVGGSYSANAKGGSNDLIIHGNSAINITGGEVHGNVYGGHYSANTENPDQLVLGNVTVTLSDKGFVDGYIFGGSFRRAQKPVKGGASPVQGRLTVDLQSGTLKGGVFAAGNHFNAQATGEEELHVRTDSTLVRLSSAVVLELGEQQGHTSEFVTLSGGYLRSNGGNATGGESRDYSTVGYDQASGTWNETAAVLEFTDSGELYSGLGELPMRLQDFDAVQVDSGEVVLGNTKLLVMHKVSNSEDKDNHDSFTKLGAGTLTLGQGLSSHIAQTESESTFTGHFIVRDGELVIGNDGTNMTQSLEGGLTFFMYNDDGNFIRTAGNKDNAYLRGINGTTFGRGGLAADGKISVKLDDTTLEAGLSVGVYYLVDGLIEGMTIDDFLFVDAEKLNDLEVDGVDVKYDLELRGENDGQLVLRVHRYDTNEWIWTGESDDQTWTQSKEGELTDDWTKSDVKEGESIFTATYYFDAAGRDGEVKLDGSIIAGSIYVTSGDYTFTQGGTGDGLSVS